MRLGGLGGRFEGIVILANFGHKGGSDNGKSGFDKIKRTECVFHRSPPRNRPIQAEALAHIAGQ